MEIVGLKPFGLWAQEERPDDLHTFVNHPPVLGRTGVLPRRYRSSKSCPDGTANERSN